MQILKSGLPRQKLLWTRRLSSLANRTKFKEEISNMLHLEHSLLRWWNLDTSLSRSEEPGKFGNVVLEKDREKLDWSCEKWSITRSPGGKKHPYLLAYLITYSLAYLLYGAKSFLRS